MADNRQFADHVEIGGANVYFQETSTTDTTMPSTSFFKTEDVDGKPVIISRDNIMGIVKDCLGSILNGLTDQTTVTKVPTLNGDTLGASAVSTLASVLGDLLIDARIKIVDYTNIWSNYHATGIRVNLYKDNPNCCMEIVVRLGSPALAYRSAWNSNIENASWVKSE